ncbi:HTH-type transcriptional regulator YesS [compost metagenome]
MLTGYKDFEYARSAMQYGVKHYLLKPCNEAQIYEALAELVAEREEQLEKERFVASMKEGMNKVLPHVKEQFLRELVSNKTYGRSDLDYYQELFGLKTGEQPVRLILFQLEHSHEYEHLFALKNIAEDLLTNVLLGATLNGRLLILVQETLEPAILLQSIEEVKRTFIGFYSVELTIALSEAGPMEAGRRLYREALQCMNHRFYVGEGSLITKSDLPADERGSGDIELDEERMALLVKSGLSEEVEHELDRLFCQLGERCLEIGVTRSYVLELYAMLIRLCSPEDRHRFTAQMAELVKLDTLPGLTLFVKEAALHVTAGYYKNSISRRSSIVERMISIVEQHYMNAELTLNAVAHEMLYMNPDYLGKVFKQVTGDNFSHYLSRLRIERAAEQIRRSGDVKVFELADSYGFGGNSKYFSQAFKKWMGMTPTEYRKSFEQHL